MDIHEYSSSVPGENSSMDLNKNYSSYQTQMNMNNHELYSNWNKHEYIICRLPWIVIY